VAAISGTKPALQATVESHPSESEGVRKAACCHRPWCSPFENAKGGAAESGGGANVGQPPKPPALASLALICC